jgi:hypothetical protein
MCEKCNATYHPSDCDCPACREWCDCPECKRARTNVAKRKSG